MAERAGVSKSVVSRVMTGAKAVSADRRAAVVAAAEELGYLRNAFARGLALQRSYQVGVLLSDLHNVFFAEVLDGIDSVAAATGYRILIVTGNRDPRAEARALEALLELRADGVILLGPRVDPSTVAAAARDVPLVEVGSGRRVPGVDSIGDDDVRGAELAVEHLAMLGHRLIAHVDGGDGAGAAERREGYRNAMLRLGLGKSVNVAGADFTEDGGHAGAGRLLSGQPRPTAIFAANDLAAVGVLNAIREAGLRVPEDLSLVGYDNTALAAMRHVSLTTIHQPRRGIGETAMRAVLRRLERPAARARRLVLEPSLVVRTSTAPPPTVS